MSSKCYHLPMKVENLRVAVLAAKAYTALALGDYIPAGSFARDLLARCSLMPIFKSARTSCNTFVSGVNKKLQIFIFEYWVFFTKILFESLC